MSRPSIIAIAGSAGALQPLQTIVSGFPPDFAVSIFILIHRSAHDGLLTDLLARKARMRVVTGRHGEPIARRTIYVAPADFHLTLGSSHMFLSRGPKINRHRPAIDPLFESAASSFGSQLIAVLLSGYLDDGTAGLAAVKQAGGMAVVQDPADAQVPNMPRNALAHVAVDQRVPAAEIAPLLLRISNAKGSAT
ncbi:MAG TPA: chemotaxis protein CheB [Terracidiphilus sp.]|nr:chemotaxis protein CheB [Terracidiphilus sp.]